MQVDSGKTYVISMCETPLWADTGYFIGALGIYFSPAITLYEDTSGGGFGIESDRIIDYAWRNCSAVVPSPNNDPTGLDRMAEITYTADFTGDLAVAVDPYDPLDIMDKCDSFAVDSAIIYVTEIPTGSMMSCDTPNGLRAVRIGPDSARILWDTVAGADLYRVWYKPVGGAPWTKVFKNGQQGRKDIYGLSPGTVYRFRVQSRCGGIWGGLSDPIVFGTDQAACALVPSAPTTLPVGLTKARVNWAKNPGTFQYKVRWRMAGDSTWTMTVKDSAKSFHWLTGLSTGTSYEWQVRSICKSGPTVANGPWTAIQTFNTVTNKMVAEMQFETVESEHVRVFPNPASEVLFVDLAEANPYGSIQVYDLAGRMLSERALNGRNRHKINLSNRTQGVYIVKVSSAATRFTTRVVVK